MESPFTHNCIATGADFLARKKDVSQIVANIHSGTNTVIYEPPKTGKQSAVRMALSQLDSTYRIHELDMQNAPFIIRPSATIELQEILESMFPTQDTTDRKDIVYIRNFQNILRLEDWDRLVAMMTKEMQKDSSPTFIITGSGVNAMRHLFETRKLFYRMYERVRLSPIDEKSYTDHIYRTFLRVGRVVEQDQAEYIYNIADGHPWYIWQIADICFNLTKGYLSNQVLSEAVDTLLYIHSVRFQEILDNLSRYQIYFLKAVFDGITKASSAEVISAYHLNSSANVHRLKEAMAKKEVLMFDAQDTPRIIDPFFRLWLERFHFTEKTD